MSNRSRLTLTVALVVTAPAAGPGCSDESCAFEDTDVAGRSANPEGLPYPPGPYGATPRQGSTPGDVFPNFSFRGQRDSVVDEDGLETISLADYHDPEQRRYRVLHLSAVAMWCPYCARETAELARVATALRAEGAALLQVAIDGPSQGEGPDRCDLADWVAEHDTSFTVVLDVGARRLGTVTSLASVPYNAIIDTRTMEVLEAGTGAPDDIAAVVRYWMSWVDDHPR